MTPFSLPRPAGKRLTSATLCRRERRNQKPEPGSRFALQRFALPVVQGVGAIHVRHAFPQLACKPASTSHFNFPVQGPSPSLRSSPR